MNQNMCYFPDKREKLSLVNPLVSGDFSETNGLTRSMRSIRSMKSSGFCVDLFFLEKLMVFWPDEWLILIGRLALIYRFDGSFCYGIFSQGKHDLKTWEKEILI